MRVRNWEKFQHYSKRNPPWIRLYRSLLDNLEFSRLPDKQQAILIQIWLLASESDEGTVSCCAETLKFRLRRANLKSEDLKPLFDNGFLECASLSLSSCITFQNGHSDLSLSFVSKKGVGKGGKIGANGYPREFSTFWEKYPRKTGKGAAHKAMLDIEGWQKLVPLMLEALEWQRKSEEWTKDKGQFIPHPATYLNQRRWEDDPLEVAPEKKHDYRKMFNMKGGDDAQT